MGVPCIDVAVRPERALLALLLPDCCRAACLSALPQRCRLWRSWSWCCSCFLSGEAAAPLRQRSSRLPALHTKYEGHGSAPPPPVHISPGSARSTAAAPEAAPLRIMDGVGPVVAEGLSIAPPAGLLRGIGREDEGSGLAAVVARAPTIDALRLPPPPLPPDPAEGASAAVAATAPSPAHTRVQDSEGELESTANILQRDRRHGAGVGLAAVVARAPTFDALSLPSPPLPPEAVRSMYQTEGVVVANRRHHLSLWIASAGPEMRRGWCHLPTFSEVPDGWRRAPD